MAILTRHRNREMLKPIETSYNGYRFRSRLEARWAVFFDVLGVRYEYEPQGYNFEGYAYLPDFRIPSWDVFVEIKPERPGSVELQRHIAFAKHAEKSLLIFYGYASANDHRVLWCSPRGYETDDLHLALCRRGCGQVFIQNGKWGSQAIAPLTDHDCLDRVEMYSSVMHGRVDDLTTERGLFYYEISWPLIWDRLQEAFDAAQGARFEFGEAWHAGLKRNEVTP